MITSLYAAPTYPWDTYQEVPNPYILPDIQQATIEPPLTEQRIRQILREELERLELRCPKCDEMLEVHPMEDPAGAD
jgi:hypothetical protein